MDLTTYPASAELQQAALDRLCTIDVSKSKKEKIENIIKNSRFNGIYCEHFLADNPESFRRALPHNQEFIEQAEEAGLDLCVLEQGIEDEGITIPLTGASHTQAKIVDYANEVIQTTHLLVREIHSGIEEQIELRVSGTSTAELLLKDQKKSRKTTSRNDVHTPLNFHLEEDYSHIPVSAYTHVRTELLQLDWSHVKNMEEFVSDKDTFRRAEEEIERCARQGVKHHLQECVDTALAIIPEAYLQNGKVIIPQGTNTKEYLKNLRAKLIELCAHLNRAFEEYLPFLHDMTVLQALDNAATHIRDYNPEEHVASSKIKNATEAHYHLKLEPLQPEDITFGNDGGCCLAMKKDYLGNDDSIPYYMLDLGTHIFGIYQQVKSKKPQRTGIVLAFTTLDIDGNPVLAGNSTELSEPANPLDREGLETLVQHTHRHLQRFAQAAGYRRVTMGTHNYNTSRNYVPEDSYETPDYDEEELIKLPEREEPVRFYNELFGEFNSTKRDVWAYLK